MAGRLAAARHEHLDVARRELLDNVGKLEQLDQKRLKAEAVEEAHRAARSGDVDAEFESLRKHAEQQRRRLSPR